MTETGWNFMKTRDAAKRLGLAPSTLNRYRVTGEGPMFYRTKPGSIRYRAGDLDEWAAARRVRTAARGDAPAGISRRARGVTIRRRDMTGKPGKRIAKVKLKITKRRVDALEPADKPWIAWDDEITGFGVRVQPSGVKSYLVNYRAGAGGRRAPNRRMVIGRHGVVTAYQARRIARDILNSVLLGDDPAAERAAARSMPTLGEAFEKRVAEAPAWFAEDVEYSRFHVRRYFGDWLSRPLDDIVRQDVEARFNRITHEYGWEAANRSMSMLESICGGSRLARAGLRNPVRLWLADGGKLHREGGGGVSSPDVVLPRWRVGIEEGIDDPVVRDAFRFGLYTGLHCGEVAALRWDQVDRADLSFKVRDPRTGKPLDIPITRQTAAILDRRRAEAANLPSGSSDWVFPSATGGTGHIAIPERLYRRISEIGGAEFWYHDFHNCFVEVGLQELDDRDPRWPMTPIGPLVNCALPGELSGLCIIRWTLAQLREPAQRTADRIDELMHARSDSPANDQAMPVRAA